MKLSQEFSLGRVIFYPATLNAAGERRKDPRARLYFESADVKRLPKLLDFVGAPESAEVLKVQMLTDLVDPDGSTVEWKGYGRLGRTTLKPPTNDRAREQGASMKTVHFLEFPDIDENDLTELLSLRAEMAGEDVFVAKITMQPTQDVLFPSQSAPDEDEEEQEVEETEPVGAA